MADFKIFSVYHKPFLQPGLPFVVPVHAGKKIATVDLGFEGDDTGDNISNLNPALCELTVLYYIWKNKDRKEFTHWGLCHYRRYFLTRHIHWTRIKKKSRYYIDVSTASLNKIFIKNYYQEIQEIINNETIILPLPISFGKMNVREQFLSIHDEGSWNLMKDILLEKYPDYTESFSAFENSNSLMIGNMMIASWEVWDNYLSWLFDIVLEFNNRNAENKTTDYQNRMPGFIAERLMNLYFIKNKQISIKQLPICELK